MKPPGPEVFGKVAVLMGGWVSHRAWVMPRMASPAMANARPGMAGPGVGGGRKVAPGMATGRVAK